jgi:5-(carboxyamino)imidazole ribonucleotide synthase
VPDALLPGILKTARMGYDGKGQARVGAPSWPRLAADGRRGLRAGADAAAGAGCSVIVARGADGTVVTCRCSATCTATASWP